MIKICIVEHRPIIERTIERVATRAVDVLLPLDAKEWCEVRNLEPLKYARALVDLSTGAWGILFAQELSSAEVNSIISGIEARGFSQVRSVLTNAARFVTHLTLHELAHLENGWGQDMERECDAWAFERM